MRHTKRIIFALFIIFTNAFPLSAQHHEHAPVVNTVDSTHVTKTIRRHNFFPHFRAAVFISHTFIPAVAENTRVAIPSYGLDLEYWFSHDWGIGLHNDLELENFIIEQDHEEFLERDYPLVSSLDLLYRPWQGLVFQIGPGIEVDKNETFFLFRLGVEYEVELGHHWDLYPTLFYDTREDAFTTISIGLGVGKRF